MRSTHAYRDAEFPSAFRTVEIVPILPEREIEKFFVDYRPSRSRALWNWVGETPCARLACSKGDNIECAMPTRQSDH